MNRRHLLLAGLIGLLPAMAQAQALSGAQRTAAIASLTQSINAITRIQGRFLQTNPDGSTVGGRFWLQRPGKVRFEYDAPSPLLLISDGATVSLQDRRLRRHPPPAQDPALFPPQSECELGEGRAGHGRGKARRDDDYGSARQGPSGRW